jgi:hypothetical protein
MGSLFSKPKPQPPARMPVPDDDPNREEAERRRLALLTRSGRDSTRLSTDKAQPYRNSLLGQA